MEQYLRWILFCSTVCGFWLIFTPFQIYCIRRFSMFRHDIIIHKRLPKLTILYGMLAVFSTSVTIPVFLLMYTVCDDPHSGSRDCPSNRMWLIDILYHIYYFWTYTVGSCRIWIVLLRFWLIFFSVNWNRSTVNKDWKIHLNPLSVDKDWYLRRKSTFGRLRYCAPRLVIVYLCCFGPILYYRLFIVKETNVVVGALHGILTAVLPVLIIVVMAMKMYRFDDAFYIIRELKLIAVLITIKTFGYSTISGMMSTMDLSLFTSRLIAAWIAVTSNAFLVYIQTLFVLRIVSNDDTLQFLKNKKTKKSLDLVEIESQSPTTSSSENENDSEKEERDEIGGIFRDHTMMEQFIRHLAKEWCVEAVLAFIEITQFQQSMMELVPNDKEDGEKRVNGSSGTGSHRMTMQLSTVQSALLENNQLPKSHIVHHNNLRSLLSILKEYGVNVHESLALDLEDELTVCKLKAFVLFQKYVVSDGGDLQINISYRTRTELAAGIEREDYYTNAAVDCHYLFFMFSSVIEELYSLLVGSHTRFRYKMRNCLTLPE